MQKNDKSIRGRRSHGRNNSIGGTYRALGPRGYASMPLQGLVATKEQKDYLLAIIHENAKSKKL